MYKYEMDTIPLGGSIRDILDRRSLDGWRLVSATQGAYNGYFVYNLFWEKLTEEILK